jgi:hypothetical protein
VYQHFHFTYSEKKRESWLDGKLPRGNLIEGTESRKDKERIHSETAQTNTHGGCEVVSICRDTDKCMSHK